MPCCVLGLHTFILSLSFICLNIFIKGLTNHSSGPPLTPSVRVHLGITFMSDDITKYCDCMEEIKRRTRAITTILSKKYTTAFPATNIEFLCLQIRKILELIALASIAANKEEYARQYKKFANHWNAKRILNDIEKVNPSFYPVPGRQIIDRETGKVVEVKKLKGGYLTKDEFSDVYDKCSEVIHSSNPYGTQTDYSEFEKLIPEWNLKITNLLNHHQIQLIDSKYQLWVLMQSKDDGRVHAFTFQRVD